MTALEKFLSLPNLTLNPETEEFEKIKEDDYNPTLYHYDSRYFVDWINGDEGDSLICFDAKTVEKAIDQAYAYCKTKNLL